MTYCSLLFSCLTLSFSSLAQSIVHVTPTGAGNNSGSSWTNALSGTQLPNRVATADSGTQFWVAVGTYKPTTTTDRTASFSIASGVAVYGGFAGTETTLEQRVTGANETVFSGDIGLAGNNADNSIFIVLIRNTHEPIQLDALTIRDGFQSGAEGYGGGCGIHIVSEGYWVNVKISNSSFIHNRKLSSLSAGGAVGVYSSGNGKCSTTITNCSFIDNFCETGGALGVTGNAQTLIEGCLFQNNVASIAGGSIDQSGAVNENSSLIIRKSKFLSNSAYYYGGSISTSVMSTIEHCLFKDNSVTQLQYAGAFNGGGALNLNGTSSVLTNCVFSNNSAPNGGVVHSNSQNQQIQQTFFNCDFVNNYATIAGGVFCNLLFDQPTNPNITSPNRTILKNCILWQNTAPDSPVFKSQLWLSPESDKIYNNFSTVYSLIQSNYPGTGNLNADPLFVNAANGDFRLKSNSPAINAGDPDTTDLPTTDLAGQPRIQGGRVDMGAYEFLACLGLPCLPFTVERKK